jgi:hypothetical protein
MQETLLPSFTDPWPLLVTPACVVLAAFDLCCRSSWTSPPHGKSGSQLTQDLCVTIFHREQ